MTHIRAIVRIAVAVLTLAAFATPASAQAVPNKTIQEILIKTSLLTFNDANVTGIYTVLHDKLSAPFREQFTPDKLAQGFKGFHDQHIDLSLIAPMTPVSVEDPKVDGDGRLTLKGYFATTPSRVNYDLAYIMSEGDWKLINISVDLKEPPK